MLEITRLDGHTTSFNSILWNASPRRSRSSSQFSSNTVSVLENVGVSRERSTVHHWIQKAELAPAGGRAPEIVVLDETIINVNGERFWLYIAVNPETNVILHPRLFPSRTRVLNKLFLREIAEKDEVAETAFAVDGVPWLQAGLFDLGVDFRHETFAPVERVFQEITRRTGQFNNTFSHAEPETVEN